MRRQLVWMAAVAVLGILARGAAAQALLRVDVNDRTTTADVPDTAPGFSPYVISDLRNSTGMAGGYTININIFDADGPDMAGNLGTFDDRDRAAPTTAPTLNQLYDDFIFGTNGLANTGGLDLSILSGGALAANTPYRFSVYAFDALSNGQTQPRTAAWLDGNNADAPVLVTSFGVTTGTTVIPPPLTDDQYKFTGVARTDGSGNLLLRARNTTPNDAQGGITPGVFLNGFEINVIPEPASLTMAGLGGLAALALRRRRS